MENRKREKIMYVITKSNFGGAQRYVFDLATRIPRGHYDISVALGGEGVLKDKLEKSDIRTINVRGLERDVNIFKEIGVFFRFMKLFKKEKPDIIHLNSSKVGGIGALAGRLTGVKNIIFTGHGWAFNEDRNPISKIIIFILHAITIILSDITIAVSEKTKRQITYRFPFLENKMPVIYNGMEKIKFVHKDDAQDHLSSLLKNNNIDKKLNWIGAVGELHCIKGHEYLIEAMSHIKEKHERTDIRLLILGEGEEREKLEKLIKNRRLEKEVLLLGRVEDARKFLKAFDIFVFPSLSEAMPYAVIEAGFASLPIIASRVGGIPEIIIDGESGTLIEPKDVFEIENKVLNLLEDEQKMAQYSSNIRKSVEEKFSIEKMVRETIETYGKY